MEQSKKKYLAPVGALLLALLLVTVITFPMLSMEVKDIPVAVFSQDEGMKTPGGTVNAGENMVKQITKSGNKALDWNVLKSKQEVQDALDDGTYYAVFTFLPGFWDAAVASWEPLRYFGEGMRALLHQGSGLWNCATIAAIVLAAVGVAVSLIAVVREKKYWETAGEKQ